MAAGEHHPFKSGLPACVHECEKQVGHAQGKQLIEKPKLPAKVSRLNTWDIGPQPEVRPEK